MLFLRCCAALGLLVVGLFLTDKRGLFFDLASLAFILGPVLAAFASVQFKKEGFLFTRGLILQVSIVGILIGFVGMIQRVSDATSIGMATGTALLVVLYASIVVGVCHLFASKNEQQINFNPLPSRLLAIAIWVLVTGFAMHGVAGIYAFADASNVSVSAAWPTPNFALLMFGETSHKTTIPLRHPEISLLPLFENRRDVIASG